MSKSNGQTQTKRQLMESAYRPGMTADQIRAVVDDDFGVKVSPSYARQFVNLHQGAALEAENQRQVWELELLKESLTRLEQALYAPGWEQMTLGANQEFTRSGLRKIVELARIMRIKNPVIKRGVAVQRLYVWAQGVNIQAANEEINKVIQEFIDDEKNKAELTTHQARSEKEVDLQTEANFFIRFFINKQTGRLRLRFIPYDEVEAIICNPEDTKEPWFYRRRFSRIVNGQPVQTTEYYPDWRYNPRQQATATAGGQVNGKVDWETPVYHVAVNRLGKFGVCEFYDALDWALAFKTFLEQLASVWQALARWAHKLTVPGGKAGVAAAKAKLNTTITSGAGETNPPPVTGSTFIQAEGGANLQPFRTAGATMSAEDGRRLLLMAAMTFGFPETFFGDASVGTLATAQSLDRPTELKIKDRQQLWADIHQNIFDFALMLAAKAPAGPLRSLGKYRQEPDGDEWRRWVDWQEGVDPTIMINFPPIVEKDTPALVGAVIDAATMKGAGAGIPQETAVMTLLNLLGIPNPDEIMKIWRAEQEAGDPIVNDDDNSGVDDDVADESLARAIAAVNEAIARVKATK